jgi:hypothetical protein
MTRFHITRIDYEVQRGDRYKTRVVDMKEDNMVGAIRFAFPEDSRGTDNEPAPIWVIDGGSIFESYLYGGGSKGTGVYRYDYIVTRMS